MIRMLSLLFTVFATTSLIPTIAAAGSCGAPNLSLGGIYSLEVNITETQVRAGNYDKAEKSDQPMSWRISRMQFYGDWKKGGDGRWVYPSLQTKLRELLPPNATLLCMNFQTSAVDAGAGLKAIVYFQAPADSPVN